MSTPFESTPVTWYAAAQAAGNGQGLWPHHLDLWLDRWTRAQHLAMLGDVDALQPRPRPRWDDLR